MLEIIGIAMVLAAFGLKPAKDVPKVDIRHY